MSVVKFYCNFHPKACLFDNPKASVFTIGIKNRIKNPVFLRRMRRIFTDKIEGESHRICGDVHKHLSIVLRAKIGQQVELCSGDGYVYTAEITSITKSDTLLKIIEKRADVCEPALVCDLYLGIIKGDHMEIALQKVTELGINSVHPIITDHTVKTDLNLVRINKIMSEAAGQCGRGRIPQVLPPVKIDEIYSGLRKYDLILFPYENAVTPSINEFLSKFSSDFSSKCPSGFLKEKIPKTAIIIGPEGGFSAAEAEALSQITTPVSLGNRILRADTACITAVSAVMYQFGELKRKDV